MVRRDEGQSLVELALTLPILAFCLLGGVDLARAFTAAVGVQSAAKSAAEAAGLGRVSADADIVAAARDDLGRTPGVDAASAAVTVTRATGPSSEQLLTVAVRYTFRTAVAWPLVPNAVVLDRSTTLRLPR